MEGDAIADVIRAPRDRWRDEEVAVTLDQLAAGQAVLVFHDPTETGYLVAAAERATCEALELMAGWGGGAMWAAMTAERLRALRVSAPDGLSGAVPVEADPQGLLAKTALPEAALDLARLSGGGEIGLYTKLTSLATLSVGFEELELIGPELGVARINVRDLVVDRERLSPAVRRVVTTSLPTRAGELSAIGYRSNRTGGECIALIRGDATRSGLSVHVHTRCVASDVFGGFGCGCSELLKASIEQSFEAGNGVVLYSSWKAGGDLGHLLPAPAGTHRADQSLVPMREREVASILRDLGTTSVRLTSNTPLDLSLLQALGVGLDLSQAHCSRAQRGSPGGVRPWPRGVRKQQAEPA
jgi:GTP cyclohydrolase II/3,4-dihydroxy-2-butanone 4-phosphate synthase